MKICPFLPPVPPQWIFNPNKLYKKQWNQVLCCTGLGQPFEMGGAGSAHDVFGSGAHRGWNNCLQGPAQPCLLCFLCALEHREDAKPSGWELQSPSVWLYQHYLLLKSLPAVLVGAQLPLERLLEPQLSSKCRLRDLCEVLWDLGWYNQYFYCRARGKDPGEDDEWEKGRFSPEQPDVPWFEFCYTGQGKPVQTALRQWRNANEALPAQSKHSFAAAQEMIWAAKLSIRSVQIHCDMGLQQKDHPCVQSEQNKGKKAALGGNQ